MTLDRQITLELRLRAEHVSMITRELGSVADVETSPARRVRTVDPVTVLSITGTAVALVNGLLALRDRLRRDEAGAVVTIATRSGDELDLGLQPDKLPEFVEGADAASSEQAGGRQSPDAGDGLHG